MPKSVVMALSGGLDSCVLLARFLAEGYDVTAVSFMYNSKHNAHEQEAARAIAEHYGITLRVVDVSPIFDTMSCSLLNNGTDLPEGHYAEDNMKSTVVPGRNLVFASILASIAESTQSAYIALGVHAGDHFIYPDCRPRFVDALDRVVNASTDFAVDAIAPFVDISKAAIVKMGLELNAPLYLTRTCYSTGDKACGKCGSCNERLEAFKVNNAADPAEYVSKR